MPLDIPNDPNPSSVDLISHDPQTGEYEAWYNLEPLPNDIAKKLWEAQDTYNQAMGKASKAKAEAYKEILSAGNTVQ